MSRRSMHAAWTTGALALLAGCAGSSPPAPSPPPGPRPYLLIMAGQSQICGRASNVELALAFPAIAAHAFTTQIWVDNITELGGCDSETPFLDPSPYTGDWETLTLGVQQSLQCDAGSHGPEIDLAYRFETEHPGEPLYIVKFSYGGIPLAANPDRGMDWCPASDHRMYWAFTKYVLPGAFFSPELSHGYLPLGFLWAQGDSDGIGTHPEMTTNHQYGENLTAFFAGLEARFPALARFPKVIIPCQTLDETDATLTTPPSEPSPDYPYIATRVIPDQQAFCANPENHAILLDPNQWPIIGPTFLNPHYDSAGLEMLAAAFPLER